jgi:para-nitrobenzyl esterase
VNGAATGLEKLRAMATTEVFKLAATVVKNQFQGFDPNSPIVDGWVLREPPAKAFAAGRQQRVDLMIGLNGRELSAFRVDAAALAKEAGPQPGSGGAGAAIKTFEDAARPIYGNWTTPALSLYLGKAIFDRVGALDQAGNDMLMACPIGAVAALTAAGGQHAYVYRFDRAIPGKGASVLGAFHGLEIPYVFNAFDDSGWNWLPFTQADRALGRTIEEYWTNFAKTGDPSGDPSGDSSGDPSGGPTSPSLPKWAAWQSSEEPYMDFTQDAQASPSHSFSPTFCHLAPDRLKDKLGSN